MAYMNLFKDFLLYALIDPKKHCLGKTDSEMTVKKYLSYPTHIFINFNSIFSILIDDCTFRSNDLYCNGLIACKLFLKQWNAWISVIQFFTNDDWKLLKQKFNIFKRNTSSIQSHFSCIWYGHVRYNLWNVHMLSLMNPFKN
jgi:hypothetical protein